MKTIALTLILFGCLGSSSEAGDTGDIYEWIDPDGMKHFINEPPPPGVKIGNEEKEIPYEKGKE